MNLLFLFLGWLLGLLSPIIVDKIRKKHKLEEIKGGLISELDEVKCRLVGAVYLLAPHYETYNKELIEWVYSNLEKYSGGYIKEGTLKALEPLLKLDDGQLAELQKQKKLKYVGRGFNLKSISVPFLDSKIGSLSYFDSKFQLAILQIKAQINILNQEIETAQFYFRMTFDSNLDSNNREIITDNLEENYRNVSSKSRSIANSITELIGQFQK